MPAHIVLLLNPMMRCLGSAHALSRWQGIWLHCFFDIDLRHGLHWQ